MPCTTVYGACDENRTRLFLIDNQASPPGDSASISIPGTIRTCDGFRHWFRKPAPCPLGYGDIGVMHEFRSRQPRVTAEYRHQLVRTTTSREDRDRTCVIALPKRVPDH